MQLAKGWKLSGQDCSGFGEDDGQRVLYSFLRKSGEPIWQISWERVWQASKTPRAKISKAGSNQSHEWTNTHQGLWLDRDRGSGRKWPHRMMEKHRLSMALLMTRQQMTLWKVVGEPKVRGALNSNASESHRKVLRRWTSQLDTCKRLSLPSDLSEVKIFFQWNYSFWN
jgi:hypothetical protein